MRTAAAVLAVVLALPTQASACAMVCFDGGAISLRTTVARPTPRPAPRPTPRPAPRPAAVAAALGLHAVTQVWAGDVVTRSGSLTTYSSRTVQQNAGTYARQIASVSTGQRSAYDAVLSNGRTALSDGRAVSGDIYANYVWTGSTLRLDRYVFFQDDRELALRRTPAPTPVPIRTRAPAPATPRPVFVVTPAPTPRPTPTPPPRVVRAGIALAPQGDALPRIEVLRGRRIDLWPRATVDGAPARIVSWRLLAGDVSALGPIEGTGDRPFSGMWEAVRADAAPYELRFAVTAEIPGGQQRTTEAAIRVVVRSPALVE